MIFPFLFSRQTDRERGTRRTPTNAHDVYTVFYTILFRYTVFCSVCRRTIDRAVPRVRREGESLDDNAQKRPRTAVENGDDREPLVEVKSTARTNDGQPARLVGVPYYTGRGTYARRSIGADVVSTSAKKGGVKNYLAIFHAHNAPTRVASAPDHDGYVT